MVPGLIAGGQIHQKGMIVYSTLVQKLSANRAGTLRNRERYRTKFCELNETACHCIYVVDTIKGKKKTLCTVKTF
jgi:hypothetical protein